MGNPLPSQRSQNEGHAALPSGLSGGLSPRAASTGCSRGRCREPQRGVVEDAFLPSRASKALQQEELDPFCDWSYLNRIPSVYSEGCLQGGPWGVWGLRHALPPFPNRTPVCPHCTPYPKPLPLSNASWRIGGPDMGQQQGHSPLALTVAARAGATLQPAPLYCPCLGPLLHHGDDRMALGCLAPSAFVEVFLAFR